MYIDAKKNQVSNEKSYNSPPDAGVLRECFNPIAQVAASKASTSRALTPASNSNGGSC